MTGWTIDDQIRKDTAAARAREEQRLLDLNMAAQPVFASFGLEAPLPVSGEAYRDYASRLLRSPAQGHAIREYGPWKDANLDGVGDTAAFETAVTQSLEAAKKAATDVRRGDGNGGLREFYIKDEAGRVARGFAGSPKSWLRMFEPPRRRLVGIFAPGRESSRIWPR